MRGACVRALPQVLPIPAVVPKADRGAGWNSTELQPWVALVYPRVMSSIFGWVEVDVGNFDIPSQGHLTVMVLAERAVPPLTRSHMHARFHARAFPRNPRAYMCTCTMSDPLCHTAAPAAAISHTH